MIKITKNGLEGDTLPDMAYVRGRGAASRLILSITRYLRSINAERYLAREEKILDIGCGDCFFLKRNTIVEGYGLDKLLGDEVVDVLDFPDDYFDCVTMLAVIEHLARPDLILKEIRRVLKSEGKFIFTSPKKSAEKFIGLYTRDVKNEHKNYFDYDTIKNIIAGKFEIFGYHTFIFGFNQVFALRKI